MYISRCRAAITSQLNWRAALRALTRSFSASRGSSAMRRTASAAAAGSLGGTRIRSESALSSGVGSCGCVVTIAQPLASAAVSVLAPHTHSILIRHHQHVDRVEVRRNLSIRLVARPLHATVQPMFGNGGFDPLQIPEVRLIAVTNPFTDHQQVHVPSFTDQRRQRLDQRQPAFAGVKKNRSSPTQAARCRSRAPPASGFSPPPKTAGS